MTQESVADKTVVDQTEAESDSAFAAGFDLVRGKPAEPPKEQTQVAQQPPEKSEPPKAEEPKEADPVKAQLDSISKAVADLSSGFGKIDQRFKSFEGRIHKVDEAVNALKDAGKAAVAAAPDAEKQKVAAEFDAHLQQVGTDLPDVAKLVEAARKELRAEIPKVDVEAIKSDLSKAFEERFTASHAATQADLAKAKAEARVLATIDLKHEGWEDDINSPEFEAWFGKQGADTKALAASPKAADAIRLLDQFKADREKAKQKSDQEKANAERLARAAAPRGVHAQPSATLNDEEAFNRGFKAVRGG